MVFSLSSCKDSANSKKESTRTDNREEKTAAHFTLNLNAQIEQDDELTLFYLINDMKQITREKSVSLPVQGQMNAQLLEFKIPDSELPTRLFLKFKNPEQLLQFKNVQFSYQGRSFKITGDRFFQFFIPNEYIEYNRATSTATAKTKKGVFKPQFSSRKVLEDKLDLVLY
jgi:hypothetical protein